MKLLRDDGLRLNPRSPELHRELAWLFLSKMGGNTDEASALYSKRWAETVDAANGDWAKLKMNPSLVSYIDRTYGIQNWRDPKSSALYWAHHGLALGPAGAVRAELRQVLYQTLMLEAIEDARFVLPNACETQMIMTMNARSLHNFFKHRCCNRAQWEIKDVADQMLSLVLKVAPKLFKNAGPACVRGGCPEGKMTCGKYKEIKEFYEGLNSNG
jgi:hypothetical protein